MAIEDVATKVENNGDGSCIWRVNYNVTIDERMVAAEARDWRQQCMGKVATDADVEQEREERSRAKALEHIMQRVRSGPRDANGQPVLTPWDALRDAMKKPGKDEPMDLLELQRRCNASSSRLDDGSATFAHIRAQRAQADLVASIRSEWDNLPDAEPAGILKR